MTLSILLGDPALMLTCENLGNLVERVFFQAIFQWQQH